MRSSQRVLVMVVVATAVVVIAPLAPVPARAAQSVGTITVRQLEARMDAVKVATLSDGGFVDVPERVVLGEPANSRIGGDTLPIAVGRSVTCDLTAVCTISEGVGTVLLKLGTKWRTVVAQAPGASATCIGIVKLHFSETVQNRVVGCGNPAPGTTRYWFLDAPPRLTTYSICIFCSSPDTTCVLPGPTERGWACGTAAGDEEWLPGCVAR